MPDQAKQGQVGRRNGTLRQLLTGQPGAFVSQQGTVPGQEAFEDWPVIASERARGQ